MHRLVLQGDELHLVLAHVAQECHPVRQLAGVLHRHELDFDLEFAAVLPLRRRFIHERLVLEDVPQHRLDHRLLPLHDAEGVERVADDLVAAAAIHRGEAFIDEGDARPHFLHRGRQDGNARGRHLYRGAEEAQLLALDPRPHQCGIAIERRGRPRRVQRARLFGHRGGM